MRCKRQVFNQLFGISDTTFGIIRIVPRQIKNYVNYLENLNILHNAAVFILQPVAYNYFGLN